VKKNPRGSILKGTDPYIPEILNRTPLGDLKEENRLEMNYGTKKVMYL